MVFFSYKLKTANTILLFPIFILISIGASNWFMLRYLDNSIFNFITERKAVNARQAGDRLRYQLELPINSLDKYARLQRTLDLSFDQTASLLVERKKDNSFEIIAFSDFNRKGKGLVDITKRPELNYVAQYMEQGKGSVNFSFEVDKVQYHASVREIYDDPIRNRTQLWLVTHVDAAIAPVIHEMHLIIGISLAIQIFIIILFLSIVIQPLWLLKYLLDQGILPILPIWTPIEISKVRGAIASYQIQVTEQRQQAIIARNAAEKSASEALKAKAIAENYADEQENITHLFSHDIKGDITGSSKDSQFIINTANSSIDYLKLKSKEDLNVKNIIDNFNFIKKYSNRIFRSTQNIFNMVDQRNKLTNLKETIDLQYWDLVNILETVISVADNQDGKFILRNECSEKTQIYCDKVFFPAVLKNLIRNGFIHNNKIEKKVQLKIWSDNNHILFKVSDNGVGMPPDYIEKWGKIQGKAAQLNDTSGSGLGLYSVRKTMEAHNSDVTVKSELTKGSSFTFSLRGK